MRVFLLLVTIALGGCDAVLDRTFNRSAGEIALPPRPPEVLLRPSSVLLDGDRILVEIADGSQCLGASGAGFTATGWTGVLSECGFPYSYSVALVAGTPAGPLPLGPVSPLLLPQPEGEPPFRPLAAVRITDSNGQVYRFESFEGF